MFAAAAAAFPQAALAQLPPAQGPQMRGDGPPPTAVPFQLDARDPEFGELFEPDAQAVELARGFGINEGIVWMPEDGGYVVVSGLVDNVLYRIDPDGTTSVFLEKAGYSGDDPSNTGFQTRAGRAHVLLIGPSCAGRDSQGRLIWCAVNDNRLMRLEADGSRTVLPEWDEQGKHLTSPNDLTILKDDTIYMTVNQFGFRDGVVPEGYAEHGIWLLKDGKLKMALSADDLAGVPNGIVASLDERHMYLSAGFKLVRYDILADGTLANPLPIGEGEGIVDGMALDIHGNIYSTGGAGPGVVRVTAPDGRLLGFLRLPIVSDEPKRQICATNVAFGGEDYRTLFIAACDAVYSVEMKVPGITNGPHDSMRAGIVAESR